MECSICLESIKNENQYILQCRHIFHKECLVYVNNQLCPLCRKPFNLGNIGFGLNKICRGNHNYTPYTNGGACRFCYGQPIKKIIELNTV
jgi:hypothetical protein